MMPSSWMQNSGIEIHVKKIIVATGWQSYDASRIENYNYSEEPDVVTNLEFEHSWRLAPGSTGN